MGVIVVLNNEKCSWEGLTGTNMENSQGKVFIGRFNVHEIGEQQMKSVHRKIQRAQKQGTTFEKCSWEGLTGTNMENSQGKVFMGRSNEHQIGEQQMKSVHRKTQRAQKQGTTFEKCSWEGLTSTKSESSK